VVEAALEAASADELPEGEYRKDWCCIEGRDGGGEDPSLGLGSSCTEIIDVLFLDSLFWVDKAGSEAEYSRLRSEGSDVPGCRDAMKDLEKFVFLEGREADWKGYVGRLDWLLS